MHEVRPPQLGIDDFEHSRWLAGGGHGAAVPVYQPDLQGGRGRTLDSDFIFHKTWNRREKKTLINATSNKNTSNEKVIKE